MGLVVDNVLARVLVTPRRLMVIVSVSPSRSEAAASGWVRSILAARLRSATSASPASDMAQAPLSSRRTQAW
jgi:hypothetical protein